MTESKVILSTIGQGEHLSITHPMPTKAILAALAMIKGWGNPEQTSTCTEMA